MPSHIQFRNVEYTFEKTTLLTDVNFNVLPGQVVAVMGRSGSGKSTLLEMCAGIVHPTDGSVYWDNEDVTMFSQSVMTAHRRKIGYLFQQHALISNMSVFDNVALPLRYHTAMPNRALQIMIEQQLEKFGIGDVRSRLPEALSVGQARLASIARALIMRPELLLMDEPMGGLDPMTTRKVIDILLKLCEQTNLTIVMVSHIIKLIEKIYCPILFINKGTVFHYENIDHMRAAEEGTEFVSYIQKEETA